MKAAKIVKRLERNIYIEIPLSRVRWFRGQESWEILRSTSWSVAN